ncbi:hypothetical protein TRFO_05596 [Tritrichomonas foetus]|uniref:Uncharacterized protein n=1 Tax=Tritrichomonas foetus TaxID=1144522 RepID=A0A1J4KAB9_9EUKA|nr:hypothetical protein TRFO_05596 [Tritrichomonas foetus]|eukprot:OHT06397.1 hypothetical protein TRFO_05596 [Tritrichomonas foetus]
MEGKKIDFILNLTNIKNVPLNKYQKDFTFVVNGKKYQTNRFIADLLSPKIAQFHYIDESIEEYHLTTQQQGDFEQFIKLVDFEHNFYSETEINFFRELFIELGNDEYFNLNSQFCELITIHNVFSRIRNKLLLSSKSLTSTNPSINQSTFTGIENEITFISEHFYQIMNQGEEREEKETGKDVINENITIFGIDILEMILQNDNLKLYDEDSLFNFILTIVETNDQYSICEFIRLLENIQFEYLSHESIEKFISIFELEYLNEKIWLSICQRLLLTPKQEFLHKKDYNNPNQDKNGNQNQNRYIIKPMNTINISYKNTINEGLFHYLRQKCSRDPHDCGLVTVTSSSIINNSSNYQPENSINPFDDDSHMFYSKNQPNQWICYEFHDFQFKLSKYQIRSFNGGPNNYHLKSWVLETSNDGQTWHEIDRQTNNSLLRGQKNHSTFDINSPTLSSSSTDFFKFIQLRQIDQNWYGTNYLIFNSIEFYGEILESIS